MPPRTAPNRGNPGQRGRGDEPGSRGRGRGGGGRGGRGGSRGGAAPPPGAPPPHQALSVPTPAATSAAPTPAVGRSSIAAGEYCTNIVSSLRSCVHSTGTKVMFTRSS